jgi:hypothetical protein
MKLATHVRSCRNRTDDPGPNLLPRKIAGKLVKPARACQQKSEPQSLNQIRKPTRWFAGMPLGATCWNFSEFSCGPTRGEYN